MTDESCHDETTHLRAELTEMDASRLLSAPLDPHAAGMLVIGALPSIARHRSELDQLVGEERTRCIDRLEPLANAMLRLHAECTIIPATPDLEAASSELSRLRGIFAAEAKMLVMRGEMNHRRLSEFSGRAGRQALVADVLLLISILHDHGEDEGETGLGREMRQAEALADELSHYLNDARTPEYLAASDARLRALSLLVETYDEVRRLVTYLRWKEGDHDEIAPSVWTSRVIGRAKRRGRGTPIAE